MNMPMDIVSWLVMITKVDSSIHDIGNWIIESYIFFRIHMFLVACFGEMDNSL
jgi:hypothetical protein